MTDRAAREQPGLAVRIARWPVVAYQALRAGRPSPCRYQPSCSTYAIEALESHGFFRGSCLAARRLSRCHPWGGHGWDPVPSVDSSRTSETLCERQAT